MTDHSVPAVRFPPPLVFLGFLLLGPALQLVVRLPGLGVPWPAAAIITVAGLAIIAAAEQRFRKTGENPIPWTGTATVIETGIYRVTRNPMYLGMAIMQAGLALWLGSLWALLLVPVSVAIVQTQVIAREEAYLAATFGAGYAAYCQRVRRWI